MNIKKIGKRAFTLIELLAVIVILAIIMLIAIPSIQYIINSSKESLNERSIDLYGRAATIAVNDYEVATGVEPSNFDQIESYIEYDDQEIECKIKRLNRDKSVYISNCEVNGAVVKDYSYGELEPICVAVTSDTKTTGNVPIDSYLIGDEYICDVNANTKNTFFILSKNFDSDGNLESVNLIMNRNICDDGSYASPGHLCMVSWISQDDYEEANGENWTNNGDTYSRPGNNDKGPITAIKYLNQATNSWDYIPNLNIVYRDAGGKYSDFVLTGKARLPYAEEISQSDTGCIAGSYGSCKLWIADYLKSYSGYNRTEEIPNLTGYWLMDTPNKFTAKFLWSNAVVSSDIVTHTGINGVRPVITLPISELDLN